MIDHDRKLLFVHIARTGGTSIESALIGRDWWKVAPETKHLSASQARRHYGDEIWRHYTKFTVVRNPWDRFVSMWTIGYWYSEDTHRQGVKPASFGEFLQTLQPHPAEKYSTLHQHRILDEPLDFVLRFEHLQSDFSAMLQQKDLSDVALSSMLKSERKPYRDYYTAELAIETGRIYREDIEQFHYAF